MTLVAVFTVIIFGACQRISLASINYLQQILPLKKIGIETDLQMGIINEENARTLAGRITTEQRFFSGMNTVSLLMRGEAAISVFILLTCLVTLASGSSFRAILGQGLLGPVMAFGVFTLVPGAIVAVACGGLMSKETLTLRPESGNASPVKTKKITLISEETGATEEIELLNPDFVNHVGVDDRIVEFEPPREESAFPLCSSPGAYYKKLAEMISAAASRPRTAVLSSENIQSLPVTVAVNIAINLVQQKQKVLMVDTDTARNALAQVFDLDAERMQKKILSCCLENLSACSVPLNKIDRLLQQKKIADSFDTLLIYAPETEQKTNPNYEIFFFGDVKQKQMTASGSHFHRVPDVQSVLK